MKRSIGVLAIFLSSYGLIGCRQQASDSTTDTSTTNNALGESDLGVIPRQDLDDRQVPMGLTRATPPDQIVAAFLDALQRADNAVAEALLTRRAYEETSKRNLTVQPVGSPQAKYTIGTLKYLGANRNGAHVNTTWTEPAAEPGNSYDIVWTLRRQDSGWRVAGMAAELVPGQKVVYLNFEDPDDMLAKWRQADEADLVGQTSDTGIREAQNPQPTGTLVR
jgi:hypothetical protein